jgi:hypothetical protein
MSAAGATTLTMTQLTGGGTLSGTDMTFSSFTYNDIGGGFGDVAVSSDNINVTLTEDATSYTLAFDFDPDISLDAEEAFEIAGSFSGAVSSTRKVVSTTLTFGFTVSNDSFVEIGQTDGTSLLNLVETTGSSFS